VGAYVDGITPVRDEALFRFDLSDIPANHTLVRATLELTSQGDAALDAGVAAVTSSWDEASVTYPGRPGHAGPTTFALVPGQTVAVDVTELARQWVSDPAGNHGLVLLPGTLAGHRTRLATRENEQPALVPVLEVAHAAVDISAPATTLTQPESGAEVTGTVELAATAEDDQGVAGVDFVVDDVVVGEDHGAPFAVSLDTTTLADGLHEVWARGVDTSGNVGPSARAAVRIHNDTVAPTVQLLAPMPGEAVTGDVVLRASAADDRAVAKIEFLVDGGLIDQDTVAPYTGYWESTSMADGAHRIVARATDLSGNVTASSPVDVVAANVTGPPLYPSVRPAAIPAGTTTSVFASARMRGAVTGAVELLGDDGTVLTTLADDGIGGDLTANDGVYGTMVELSGTGTSIPLRVRATLDGTVVTSSPAVVVVAPTGVPTALAPTTIADPLVDGSTGERLSRDQLLVSFADDASFETVLQAVAEAEGSIAGWLPSTGTWQVAIAPAETASDLQVAMASLAEQPGVFTVEPNVLDPLAEVEPNDDVYPLQYGPRIVRAEEAWVVNRGEGIFFQNNQRRLLTAAVLDSGLDFDHPDLLGPRFRKGRDFVNDDANPADDHRHGTRVAGVVSANTDNDEGIAGISWHTDLLVEKVCTPDGCPTSAQIDGIDHAVSKGAAVINMSIGGGRSRSENVVKALDRANRANVLVVIAAGNEGTSAKRYPGGYDQEESFSSWFGTNDRTYHTSVLTVGGTTEDDTRWEDSNHGDWVELAAPAEDISIATLQSNPEDPAYDVSSGTSFAAPYVTGAALLVLNDHINWGEDQVRARLIATAHPLPEEEDLGAGRLDLFDAVFNGGFETGDLDDWSLSGAGRAVRELGPIRPKDGSGYMALVSTGSGAVDDTTSTLERDFYVLAGSGAVTVRLDYNFVSEEYPEFVGTRWDDRFEAYLLLSDGRKVTLAEESVNVTSFTSVDGIDFPGGDGTTGQSGWKTGSATFNVEGTTSVTFVVEDVGDRIYDSVVLIDNIRLD
jgi:hypothetical protein